MDLHIISSPSISTYQRIVDLKYLTVLKLQIVTAEEDFDELVLYQV